jgi:hypothetical protein
MPQSKKNSIDKCAFPKCPNKVDVLHMNGEKKLGLCVEHDKLYEFMHTCRDYDDDWGM